MAQNTVKTNIAQIEVRDEQWAVGFFRRLARSQSAVVSLVFVVLVILVAIFGPLIYRVDPARTDFTSINAPISAAHPLGTDRLGHDTLARLLAALQVSLLVAGVA